MFPGGNGLKNIIIISERMFIIITPGSSFATENP